jgi:Spy/CpxP family protein refolding chaperone
MKTIRKGIISAMLFALLTITLSAQSGQGRGYGPGVGGNQEQFRQRGLENMLTDLTEDQKTALAELRKEHYRQMKDFRNQMGVIRAKQRTIMSDYEIDEKAAAKLIDQKTDLLNKQMKAKVAHKAALNQILTEDQLMKLEQHHKHRRFAHKGRRNRPGANGNFRHGGPR